MKRLLRFVAFLVAAFVFLGCGQTAPDKSGKSKPTQSPGDSSQRAEAKHLAEFTHVYPRGGSASTTTNKLKEQPFYGFDGHKLMVSLKEPNGDQVKIQYEFELVDSRDSKDVYQITRRVTGGEHAGSKTIKIAYKGEGVTVFDDQVGFAIIGPIKSP